mmetsp:Transcript_26624/g.85342  ORF Transcript_26624/g.85342 Transcript_26624/m.85342 type:complete len:254 (+) Transcript_26624:431-1192(+)
MHASNIELSRRVQKHPVMRAFLSIFFVSTLGVMSENLSNPLPFCELRENLHDGYFIDSGKWENGWWVPHDCVYDVFEGAKLRVCVENKSYLFIGDSLARDMAITFGRHLNPAWKGWPKTKDVRKIKEFKSGGTKILFLWIQGIRNMRGIPKVILSHLKAVSFVGVHSALWDMGKAYLGVQQYFTAVRRFLISLKNEGGKRKHPPDIVWLALHALHPKGRREKFVLYYIPPPHYKRELQECKDCNLVQCRRAAI